VYAVEAEGKRARYEADNLLSNEQIDLQKSLALLRVLPELIANAVKPLENIEGIKILQGYGGNSGYSAAGTSSSDERISTPQSLSEQVTSAALNYRANAPLVDNMLKEIGLVDKENGSLEDLLTGNHNLIKQSVAQAPTNDPVNTSESNIS